VADRHVLRVLNDESQPARPGLRANADLRLFLPVYAPKWGKEAAISLFRQKRWLGVSSLPILWSLVLAEADALPAWAIPLGLFLAMPLALKAAHYARRVRTAASHALGVDVGIGGFRGPPVRHKAYLRWCAEKGVRPYQALEEGESPNQVTND
jgi:hypothetical protein